MVEVSSGFAENHGRQDKVYQVISQFKLLLGQRANWDAASQIIRVRVGPSGALPPCSWVAFWGIMEPDDAPATSCTIRFIKIKKNGRKLYRKEPI